MTSLENRHVKRGHYDAVQYADSFAGRAIAQLRPLWEKQFPTNEATDCNEDSDGSEMDEWDCEFEYGPEYEFEYEYHNA